MKKLLALLGFTSKRTDHQELGDKAMDNLQDPGVKASDWDVPLVNGLRDNVMGGSQEPFTDIKALDVPVFTGIPDPDLKSTDGMFDFAETCGDPYIKNGLEVGDYMWTVEFIEAHYQYGEFIGCHYDVDRRTYIDNVFQKDRIAALGVYQTRELATVAANKLNAEMRVEAEVRRLNGDWVPDWSDKSDSQPKYIIKLGAIENCLEVDFCWSMNLLGTRYLKSKDSAVGLVNSHGDDIRLMLGVSNDL